MEKILGKNKEPLGDRVLGFNYLGCNNADPLNSQQAVAVKKFKVTEDMLKVIYVKMGRISEWLG